MEQIIEGFRLSPQQERLWKLLSNTGGPWCAQVVVSMEGDLDRKALRSALLRVVDRHEILRTTFRNLAGHDTPIQVVGEADVAWEEESLDRGPHEALATVLLRRAAQQPFVLGRGPLVRACLVTLSAREHLLALSLPSLCADAASLTLLVREIVRETGPHSVPAAEPMQYIDVSDWQHEALASGEGAGFWHGRDLSGHAGWRLPFELSPKAEPAFSSTVAVQIAREDLGAAEQLAASCGAPAAAFFLLAWQCLLCRLALLSRVTLGVAFDSRRGDSELAGVLGPLTRALPLSCDLEKGGSFRDLLVQAGRDWREVERWQSSFAWERLTQGQGQEAAGFHATFSFETAPEPVTPGGLRIAPVAQEAPFESSAVDLSCALMGPGLSARLRYDPSRFPATEMTRLAALFHRLVTSALAEPGRAVGELDLLTTSDRVMLEARGDVPEREPLGEAMLHELFSAAAASYPDSVAVSCGEEDVTYAELERRSNRLAHHLCRLGVEPESLVGLCLERSLNLVVGLLGILKAGGAYVPVDPDAPAERIAFTIRDARMAALVTAGSLADRIPQSAGLPVIRLDADGESLDRESETAPASGARPGNAAYVIYTSGSTGQPKGVVVSHTQAVRLLTATRSFFDFGLRDVWTLFHSVAFDFSVWEIWGALAHGARLVIVPYWVSRTPSSFYELLSRERVTVLNQTPSAFRQLVLAEGERAPDPLSLALRHVIFGGEALDMASLEPWFGRHGDAQPRLVNMYGITETTVHVTFRPVSRADLGAGSLIGGPLPDLCLHLLDPGGRRVPVFAPGEIYVSGAGLARGYLHHPTLTAERFVPDSFSSRPGARLYRSGDQARLLPGPDLEYLGRVDEQVKIRGFRIEPGEIRTALLAHAGVREAVAVLRDGNFGKRLIAYVVAETHSAPSAADLREFLAGRLPDYMIPAAFVHLQALPLSQNGKLDRKSLPEPDPRHENESAFVPTCGLEEDLLAAIWERVLEVGRVGRNDNFFALGGDSIRSILVQSEAREAGFDITAQQLFRYPTIRELARELRHSAITEQQTGKVLPFGLIMEADRQRLSADIEDAYPLALLQAGMLFHSELNPESAVYHDIFSSHLQGLFDLSALRTSIARLTANHPLLRTSFHLSGFNEPLQLVHREVELPLVVTDLRHLSATAQDTAIDAWMESEKRRAFDWRRPPLLRIEVHRRGESSFQFSLGFHHAILDGWSLASMLSELFRRYLELAAHEAGTADAPLATSYRDFVAAERWTLRSEESRRYWAGMVSDRAHTRLPSRSEGPQREVGPSEVRGIFATVPSSVSNDLRRVARQVGVPLKSVLLAAHIRALAFLSGETEVMTGLITNGRLEEDGGEQVLGLFLNTVPFRLRLAGGSWLGLVRHVFAAELSLLPHRRFPLAEIQRMMGGQPLIDTVFNFIHFHVYEGLRGLQGLELVTRQGYEKATFPFAAVFSLARADGPVQLRFDIRAEFLDQGSVIQGVYERTLAALANAPEATFESAVLLSETERAQLLDAGEGAAWPPPAAGVHDLFVAQAERVPDAVALAFGDESVTYGELNARTNRLAHHLRHLGVGPETLVGLCLRRSPALVTAIFGALRAGGAYLSLDPEYPAARIDLLLADAEISVLVSEEDTIPAAIPAGVRTVLLDRDGTSITRKGGSPLPERTSLAHAAYVIYTSGSTGLPKGVTALHEGLASFSQAVAKTLELGPGHRMLQFASPSFDASALQIFPTLISGATLVLHPNPASLTSAEILDLCKCQGVTVLDLPGALWRQWVDTMAARNERLPDSIAIYMTGGEKLPGEILRQWSQMVPATARFLSSYGPTEATVTTTFFMSDGGAAAQLPAAATPLGGLLPSTRLRLLDAFMAPVPAGVPGEILIGGTGLARGYLRRPALTAERFVPDPSPEAELGSRLYRTGDLARWRLDGELDFVGRLDHQIKIRGFRVEPGEIEAALARHPAVREAIVLKREDLPGLQRLVAYILPESSPVPAASDLRELLGRSLPDHMIPSAFVTLDSLPLLLNGKLDRAALPAPEMSERFSPFVSPRGPLEQILAEVWAQVLKVERVSVIDNFFELGGHSLMATQALARIREAFDIDLQLRSLFEEPTVAGLAELLRHSNEGDKVEQTASLRIELAGLSDEEVKTLLLSETAAEKGFVP
jgi:amino acid adenylation domain-containing protein